MNFLVIGHLCYDEIQYPDHEPVTGFGGIFYSMATLAAVAGSEHKVIPVFGVGDDRREELFSRLSEFSNITTDGIFSINGNTNTVKIFYDGGTERIECSENIAPPIPVSAVQPYIRRSDAILIDMISGFDITFDVLYAINQTKKSKDIPVHLDIHSLTLGVDENNKRFRRPVMDWRRWVFYSNIVQMNQLEAATLTVERLSELQLAKIMMTLGPTTMLVTRGEKGACIYRANKKKVESEEIAGIQIKKSGNNQPGVVIHDSPGCGDVFGAAFLSEYVKTGDSIGAARFANRIAAVKVTMPGSANLASLTDVRFNEA